MNIFRTASHLIDAIKLSFLSIYRTILRWLHQSRQIKDSETKEFMMYS